MKPGDVVFLHGGYTEPRDYWVLIEPNWDSWDMHSLDYVGNPVRHRAHKVNLIHGIATFAGPIPHDQRTR